MSHKNRRSAAAIFCCAAALLTLLTGCGKEEKAAEDIPAATNEQRVTYLNGLGWQVDPEPLETLALQLPRELGEEYGDYLRMQSEQGLPFDRCAGRATSRYTYAVTNYPGYDGPVQINLWVCDGMLAGGDLIAPGENGFTAGLRYPR